LLKLTGSRGGKAVRLTYDHKGSDHQEAKRITDAGGFVMNNRVNGKLPSHESGRQLIGRCSRRDEILGRCIDEGIRGRLTVYHRDGPGRIRRVPDRCVRWSELN
jgi:hypothetical protein